MAIRDARQLATTLDGEGFALVPHRSAVTDFTDAADVQRLHPAEIAELIQGVSGADEVMVTGTGVLRFAERSTLSGALDNSKPARFARWRCSPPSARSSFLTFRRSPNSVIPISTLSPGVPWSCPRESRRPFATG
jgi:hypothetical protein